MAFRTQILPKVFSAIQHLDIEALCTCSEDEIRPVLPCLVRMGLISPLDTSKKCSAQKIGILTIIAGIEWVNSIVALLSINFHVLEADVKKEQQLRQKITNGQSQQSQTESVLIGSLANGLALEYERSDMTRRLRLVLSELLFIQSQTQDFQGPVGGASESSAQTLDQEFYVKPSDLFDNDIYVEEIADVICIALAELPTILSISSIVEVLLHVNNGPSIICRIVANFPDAFREVCTQLISKGEKQEENSSSSIRATTISMLCRMNPAQALAIRGKCVELCRMPALAVMLTLQQQQSESESDMVAFISGLMLGSNLSVRMWFGQFVKTGHKRKGEISANALLALREELVARLQLLVDSSKLHGVLPDESVVQASALLRLYCAMRGIATIKLQDDEVSLLVSLLTSHPNPTPAGVRFVSIGLCMLIACSSLIASGEHERRCIEWVQWLIKEEAYFESASGVSASFGEMLLLMAIHFHSNQLSAICELVSSTLGMKTSIRHNNMTRMKAVFTQEIFTEQIVTTHAVKVPVTTNLNATMAGFLPVHCIHQLLKSRAFTKHNVNIKHWIYRQICTSTHPLHPVLPQLIEVYVTSILLPNHHLSGAPRFAALEAINKPLSENEIRNVFQNSIFGEYLSGICGNTSQTNLNTPLTTLNTPQYAVNTPLTTVGTPTSVITTPPNLIPPQIAQNTLTPQLLLLYYLLLYEDGRLTHAQIIASSARKIKIYSSEFLSELPIKYLLHHAQKDQSSYSTLFGPLLKLLATHFPHLTLVDDWVDDMAAATIGTSSRKLGLNQARKLRDLENCFGDVKENPSKLAKSFQQLLREEAIDIWPFAETITQNSIKMLDHHVPRYLQDLYKDVWFKLNAVLPRRLWVMTVKNLVGNFTGLTRIDVSEDPLQIMRCDDRVFRCAPIFCIVLRVLRASLASSRSQLSQHLQSHPKLDAHGQLVNDAERDDMCRALISAQVSFLLVFLYVQSASLACTIDLLLLSIKNLKFSEKN